jgi:hypothetical protein
METAEDALKQALLAVEAARDSIPDDMPHTAARNRITMACLLVEEAQDLLAAAQRRMPSKTL